MSSISQGALSLLLLFLSSAWLFSAASTPVEFAIEKISDLRYLGGNSKCQVTLRLRGAVIDEALGYRDVTLTQVTVDGGQPLDFSPEPSRASRSFPPEGDKSVTLALPSPPRSATKLEELAGSITLEIYKRQKLRVENILDKRNQKLKNPLFEAHGLKIRSVNPQQGFPTVMSDSGIKHLEEHAVVIEVGGQYNKVFAISLLDSEGRKISASPNSFSNGKHKILSLMAGRPISRNASLLIEIPTEARTELVNFSLKEVPLP